MTTEKKAKPQAPRMGVLKALLLSLPMLLLTTLMLFGQLMGPAAEDPLLLIAGGLTWLAFNVVFFLMLRDINVKYN